MVPGAAQTSGPSLVVFWMPPRALLSPGAVSLWLQFPPSQGRVRDIRSVPYGGA